jgi:hypothetical protein
VWNLAGLVAGFAGLLVLVVGQPRSEELMIFVVLMLRCLPVPVWITG